MPYTSPTGGAWIGGVGASAAGDVYVATDGGSAGGWRILERPAGATQFVQVYTGSSTQGGPQGPNFLSVDAAGNVYFTTENYVTVTVKGKTTKQGYSQVWRRQPGAGTFSLVDTSPASESFKAIQATPQGVFEVGRLATASGNTGVQHWVVRKSPTGDPGTWSTVDDYQLDAADNLSSSARVVSVDAAGNVLVGGVGTRREGSKGKYTNVLYGLVRRSADGGATWTTEMLDSNLTPNGIATDAAGNTYVGGTLHVGGAYNASVVRMKASGGTTWSIADQFGTQAAQANGYGLTVDSNNNLYVVGGADDGAQGYYGFVRSMPGTPASATQALFSTVSITTTDASTGTQGDILGSDLNVLR